ncbi:MAG: hypothetical protein N2595_06965 [bacterium]|nr:hypothetical protein [bacterium]
MPAAEAAFMHVGMPKRNVLPRRSGAAHVKVPIPAITVMKTRGGATGAKLITNAMTTLVRRIRLPAANPRRRLHNLNPSFS